MGFLSEGKKKEKEFASHFDNVKFSTAQQDMKEHWDLMIDGLKYDVKGMKKINRSDPEPNESYHYLEILNVYGKRGWAYGKADLIAFETNEYWVMVRVEKVQELIKAKVSKTWVTNNNECLYCLYRREGRKDCMTLVKTLDLMVIADKIITKKIGVVEHVIGDSIIPEKAEQKRLENLFKEKVALGKEV